MSEALNRTAATIRLTSVDSPFHLECGAAIAPLAVAYETYGTLNEDRSNVILVCHALTGSAHAAGTRENGTRGWWDGLIGPGKAIDTGRYFVVCSNVLGGRYGSSGPNSLDAASGTIYGRSFPAVTVRDMVRAQRLLLWKLGVERVHAVIGGSMGGMQVLEWALLFPDDVDLIIPMATSAMHSPWRTAFSSVAREAIALGRAAGDEEAGLRLARKIATMTYRSSIEFAERFRHEPFSELPDSIDRCFPVQSYLGHQGERFIERFDTATYETLTRAMDLHDIRRGRGSLEETLGTIRQPALCLGITTDVLYPAHEQRELSRLLPNGIYREIDSPCGHDAFLIEYDQVNRIVGEFLAPYEPALHVCTPATQSEDYQLL